jgi:hypothetical protein
VFPVQAIKVYGGSGGIDLLILNFDIGWGERLVSCAGRFTSGEWFSGTHWVGHRTGLGALKMRSISCPPGNRTKIHNIAIIITDTTFFVGLQPNAPAGRCFLQARQNATRDFGYPQTSQHAFNFRHFRVFVKSAYSLRHIRPSVRMYQRGCHWKNFLEIWQCGLLWKSGE